MKRGDVHLGYEVGTGAPVSIPVRHLCVAGQTQEAGKTTTLEGLISRSGLRAITFITKRGEGSFREARRVEPYFREQADWQFVASLLEASRGEKLKFERAWIIRASKGAKTLAEVHRNVKKFQKDARGLSADVYLTLDAYLDAVVPTIGKVKWAKTVSLAPGVNVMDLTALPSEMQHLVIKSTLDFVLEHCEDTIVVVPEAWKFIPQGRGTPVKLAAESFIRQAAGLKNYLWLDSQDIGGIEKTILRSVPVWVLGVQREANELKRTLENLPASAPRLKPADISSLSLGQFFACWGQKAIKTYVQPAWMRDADARKIALGGEIPNQRLYSIPVRIGVLAGSKSEAEMKAITEAVNNPAVLGDDEMNPTQERKLDTLIELMTKHFETACPAPAATELRTANERLERVEKAAPSAPSAIPSDVEVLYAELKRRLVADIMEDPKLLRLMVDRPEIEVTVRRETLRMDTNTLDGRIATLIADGFFNSPKSNGATLVELERRGWKSAAPRVSESFGRVMKLGFLYKENDGYVRVAGMVVNIVSA